MSESSQAVLTNQVPLTFQQLFLLDYLNLRARNRRLDAFALRIRGDLNIDMLRDSIGAVVQRHDCLRARVSLHDTAPTLHVDGRREFYLDVGAPLRTDGVVDVEARAKQDVEEFSNRECDMSIGPLFEAKVIELSNSNHVLVWASHHIISDAFSARVMFREIWKRYSDLLLGRPVTSEKSVMSYSDYALWQHRTHPAWLKSHDPYWRKALTGAEPLKWPVGELSGEKATRLESAVELKLATGLRTDLRRVAQQLGTTFAMVMLTVYVAVLSKWCNQGTFIVPVNVAGRHRPEHQRMLGYFAQLLYLRVDLTGCETCVGLLHRVSQEFHLALLHQDFGRIAVQAPGALSGAFFSMMPWQIADVSGVPDADISSEINLLVEEFPFTRTANREGKYKFLGIAVQLFENSKSFLGWLSYDPERFAQNTVERFARDFRLIANEFGKSPGSDVGRALDRLSSGEYVTPE